MIALVLKSFIKKSVNSKVKWCLVDKLPGHTVRWLIVLFVAVVRSRRTRRPKHLPTQHCMPHTARPNAVVLRRQRTNARSITGQFVATSCLQSKAYPSISAVADTRYRWSCGISISKLIPRSAHIRYHHVANVQQASQTVYAMARNLPIREELVTVRVGMRGDTGRVK